MKRPIAIGLSPNTKKEDVLAALRLLCKPWQYLYGDGAKQLERWFRNYFNISYAVSFNSARSGLYAVLHTLDIKAGDEVIIQAYTCVAVPNAIMATGAKPIYVDIDSNCNIDPMLIEKNITKKTKAILVQHTFGTPAQLDRIMKLVKKYRLLLIEDVAHTIGGVYNGRKLGTFGTAAVFSFGRDKAFSSVFGGMVITQDPKLGKKLRSYQQQRNYPTFFSTYQQLWYPIITSFILSTYYMLSLGKICHFILRRIQVFSSPVTSNEKKGIFSSREVKKYPNALAQLGLLQIKRLYEYNTRREYIGKIYQKKLPEVSLIVKGDFPWLRFPLLVNDKKKCIQFFASKGIFIGDWYTQAIDPRGVVLSKIHYIHGSCPRAELYAKKMVNLPTYPTLSEKNIAYIVGVSEMYQKEEHV